MVISLAYMAGMGHGNGLRYTKTIMFTRKGSDENEKKNSRRGVLFRSALVAGALVLWGPTIYVNLATRSVRYELSRVNMRDIPHHSVGIVLGAALRKKGTEPSAYLKWRIDTAVKLYKAGKVDMLLMSGDGSYYDHDEPYIMRREAIAQGVPANKIEMDKFGFDTYDSCTRAMRLRNITSAIVVTQGYHLPRAVYSCRVIGMDAVGVNAQSEPQKGWSPMAIAREWLSTDKLFMQLAWHKVRTLWE